MSWKASAWAKEQRLGSPAAKSVLMCLADYADPDGMIKGWASQSDLAEAAEVSERTAREWLQRLEEWGLLERQRQQRPSGARAADWILLRLDVRVLDGAERCRGGESLPANPAGRTYRQPDAEPTGNQAHPTGSQFRAYKDKPPIEPPLPSQQERADAREREGETEDRKKAEAQGWGLLAKWPGFKGMPKEAAMKAWLSMSQEDRDMAESRFDAWLALLKAQRKDHVPAPSTYFRERLFADVPEAGEARPAFVSAAPFGKLWAAARMARLLAGREAGAAIPALTASQRGMVDAGQADEAALMREKVARFGFPAVNGLHEAAAAGRPVSVAARYGQAADATEPVRVGSERWAEWEAEHRRRGWPWVPDPGRVEWVYFPAGGPGRLGEFEAAIRGEAAEAAE